MGSDSERGQPANVGQPWVSWVPTGLPEAKKFSRPAPAPFGLVVRAVLEGDGDAVGAPRAPAVEAAAEEVERADVDVVVDEARARGAVGLAPLNGVPVALTWTSGKSAQPCAGTNASVAAEAGRHLGQTAREADAEAAARWSARSA